MKGIGDEPKKQENRSISFKAKIIVSLVTLLIVGIVSEVFVRIYYPALDPFVQKHRPFERTIFNFKVGYVPGVYGTSTLSTDKLGFRVSHDIDYYKKPTGIKRIFFIGGSTIEQAYIDDASTTEVLLEKKFNTTSSVKLETINTARSGLISVDNYRMAQEVIKYKPDYIVFLIGINDLRNILEPMPNERHSGPDLYAGYENRNKLYIFLNHSHLFRHLVLARAIILGHLQGDLIATGGEEFAAMRTQQHQLKEIRMSDETKKPHAGYAPNIELIAKLLEANKVHGIFLTQPSLWSKNMPEKYKNLLWMTSNKLWAGFRYDPGDLAESLEMYNDVVRNTVAQEHSEWVDMIDLSKLLPKDTTVFYDDVHFNYSGAEKIANILVDYFNRQIPHQL